jgi:hypothetical protein
MKSWTAAPFQEAIREAIVLAEAAVASYARLAEVSAAYRVDPSQDPGYLELTTPSGLWLGAMDVSFRLRISLDWTAFAVWRQYTLLPGGVSQPTFPVPKKVTHSLSEAQLKLKKRFPGLATGNPDLLRYFEGVIENSDGSFDWLHCLHELVDEMKHRMPMRQALRVQPGATPESSSGSAAPNPRVLLAAETAFEGFPDVLSVFDKSRAGVLGAIRDISRMVGVGLAVPPDGPLKARSEL